ncbi:MAG: HD-GYP domain-containing protein [Eubacteriales bacterium]|nr:HD-GYP domain-containing protein [Eubacteriales bacterium]
MQIQKVDDRPIMGIKIIDTALYTQIGNNAETTTHSNRVSQLCRLLGKAMKLPDAEIYKLEISGRVHDIGKAAIKSSILSKEGPLTEEELNEIMRHPEIGYNILKYHRGMTEIAEYVLSHHERYDGSGYPAGLKREQIPLLSRIIAVVDSYDAMTNPRPYKSKLDEDEAVLELIKNKGKQFDPIIVDAFIREVLRKTICAV